MDDRPNVLRDSQIQRFMRLVDQRGTEECWPWLGTVSNGYGYWAAHGRFASAHRVAYMIGHGEIPEGLAIDHVRARGCVRTDCVNPGHLEAVTTAENTRRGTSPSAIASGTGRCRNGHELAGANVVTDRKGGRECRTCRNARYRDKFHAANPDSIRYKTGLCKKGHQKTPETTLPNGACRICSRESKARARARRKVPPAVP